MAKIHTMADNKDKKFPYRMERHGVVIESDGPLTKEQRDAELLPQKAAWEKKLLDEERKMTGTEQQPKQSLYQRFNKPGYKILATGVAIAGLAFTVGRCSKDPCQDYPPRDKTQYWAQDPRDKSQSTPCPENKKCIPENGFAWAAYKNGQMTALESDNKPCPEGTYRSVTIIEGKTTKSIRKICATPEPTRRPTPRQSPITTATPPKTIDLLLWPTSTPVATRTPTYTPPPTLVPTPNMTKTYEALQKELNALPNPMEGPKMYGPTPQTTKSNDVNFDFEVPSDIKLQK